MTTLRSIATDRDRALEMARAAIHARKEAESEAAHFISAIERDVSNGSALGVLRYQEDGAVGIALWEPTTSIGLTIQVLHLTPGHQSVAEYREFFGEIAKAGGPIALAPGLLAGLSEAEESEVMRALGFAEFGRSEMRFPLATPEPAVVEIPGLRGIAPDDESALARLHELAYRDSLDRFLFLFDPDPVRDAEVQVHDIQRGRWGEFLPWASFVVASERDVAAATLVVRAHYGPLIADVMVDPRHQGRGLGRAVMTATVLALRQRNESVIALNVTEGNTRAIHLYDRIGFVRTLGPSHGWYSTERIHVMNARA